MRPWCLPVSRGGCEGEGDGKVEDAGTMPSLTYCGQPTPLYSSVTFEMRSSRWRWLGDGMHASTMLQLREGAFVQSPRHEIT